MRCEHVRDQDTLRTQDDDSTVQTMLPLDEISLNRLRAAMAAMAATAATAAMAVMAAVLSSMGIRDYGN
jgi:hypothetical protein